MLKQYLQDPTNPNVHRALSNIISRLDSGELFGKFGVTAENMVTNAEEGYSLFTNSVNNGILYFNDHPIAEYAVFESLDNDIAEAQELAFHIKSLTFGIRCIYGEVTNNLKRFIYRSIGKTSNYRIVIFELTPRAFGSFGYTLGALGATISGARPILSIFAQVLSLDNIASFDGYTIPRDTLGTSLVVKTNDKALRCLENNILSYGYQVFISSTHTISKTTETVQTGLFNYISILVSRSVAGKAIAAHFERTENQLLPPINRLISISPEIVSKEEIPKKTYINTRSILDTLKDHVSFNRAQSDQHLAFFEMGSNEALSSVIDPIRTYLKWRYYNDRNWATNRNSGLDKYFAELPNPPIQEPKLPNISDLTVILQQFNTKMYETMTTVVDQGCPPEYIPLTDQDIGNPSAIVMVQKDAFEFALKIGRQQPQQYNGFVLLQVGKGEIGDRIYSVTNNQDRNTYFLSADQVKEYYGESPIIEEATTGASFSKMANGTVFYTDASGALMDASTIRAFTVGACKMSSEYAVLSAFIGVVSTAISIISNIN